MTTNIAIRLQAEGSAEIKRTFDDVGNSGRTAFDGVTSAMDRTSTEADQVVRKVREATEAARAAQTTANTASTPSAPRTPASVAPSATTAQINRLRAQLDEEYRNQSQGERAARLIAQGEGSGQFTPAYAERLRNLADRKYGPQNDNQKEGLNTYDKLFVKYQLTDSAQQLYAGASPSLVALQQGGQVFQQLSDREGGLKTGLSQLAETAKGLVTPFALAGTATVAAAAVFALAASSYHRIDGARDRGRLHRVLLGTLLERVVLGLPLGAVESILDCVPIILKLLHSLARSTGRLTETEGLARRLLLGIRDLLIQICQPLCIDGSLADRGPGGALDAFVGAVRRRRDEIPSRRPSARALGVGIDLHLERRHQRRLRAHPVARLLKRDDVALGDVVEAADLGVQILRTLRRIGERPAEVGGCRGRVGSDDPRIFRGHARQVADHGDGDGTG